MNKVLPLKSIYRFCFIIICFLINSCDDLVSNNDSTSDWKIDAHTTITYSKHAQCRMSCRYIDGEEVREILMKNKVNPNKTRISHQGESRAYEGVTHDGQSVRIVAAQKKVGQIHIVTVIDLENDWSCNCD